MAELGERLIVASVQESIDKGRVREEPGNPSRNRLQTTTLLDAIPEHQFDAVFGGARRDEEKARAKERVFSLRDEFGQWEPRSQRPELWNLYNGRIRRGQHMRVFPISNWTEMDVWQYIEREDLEVPSIYFAHERDVFRRDSMWLATSEFLPHGPDESVERMVVRYRTVGDMTCTGAVRSDAATVDGHHRRGRGRPDHGARRHPRRRRLLARRPWKTASARATSRWICCASPPPARSTTASSTLIGRLLFDSKGIFEDQLAAIERTSRRRGYSQVDLALLTDGLRAEREQGITIDVAYRYFATPRRKFIIADTPGHVQYTRNMVTGASTADLAIVLIDARNGVLEQSRRHAFIAALLGIPHIVVAVNKMDLVGYERGASSRSIRDEFADWAAKLDVHDIQFIPITALHGDNVVQRSHGDALVPGAVAAVPPRARLHRLGPQPHRRALPGAVGHPARRSTSTTTSGAMPARSPRASSGRATRSSCCRRASARASSASPRSTASWRSAAPPLSVVIQLEDDIDVSRGDMLCRPHNQPDGRPRASRRWSAG